MTYNQITRSRFDAEAKSYDDRMLRELNRNRPIYALVAEQLKKISLQSPGQQMVVSDICCGTGFAWSRIMSEAPELDIYAQGIDFSQSMVSLAQQKEIYNECICHDVTEPWSFSRQSDLAFCIRDSLSNISEGYEHAVANIVSNMKPGSTLVIDGNFLSSTNQTKLHSLMQELYRNFCSQFPDLQYEQLESSFPEFLYYATENNVYPSRLKLYRMNELHTLLDKKGILINGVYGISYVERGKLFVFPHWKQGIDTILTSDCTETSSDGIETFVIVGSIE